MTRYWLREPVTIPRNERIVYRTSAYPERISHDHRRSDTPGLTAAHRRPTPPYCGTVHNRYHQARLPRRADDQSLGDPPGRTPSGSSKPRWARSSLPAAWSPTRSPAWSRMPNRAPREYCAELPLRTVLRRLVGEDVSGRPRADSDRDCIKANLPELWCGGLRRPNNPPAS